MSLFSNAQPAIAVGDTPAAFSIEWHVSAPPAEVLAALQELAPAASASQAIVGLGDALLRMLGLRMPGFQEFRGLPGMPATPHALWTFVPAPSTGEAFERCDVIAKQLRGCFVPGESASLFRYRNGRDLSGYQDGAANPQGEEAERAALIPDGPRAGGSFALVQRYRHDRRSFAALPADARDAVVGRTEQTDLEIDTAPESSHVKRTAQETFSPPAFVLRRSMPWGDPVRHGLQYIAFMADTSRAEQILRRMAGLEDGIGDALLRYTRAETGAYYYCPPLRGGRLDLSS